MYARLGRPGALEREILDELRSFGSAAQVQKVVRWLVRGIGAGLASAVVLLIASRLLPIGVPMFLLWLLPALGFLTSVVVASVWRPTFVEIAARVDLRLALKERARTAVELIERRQNSPLATVQLHDTLSYLRKSEGSEAFPVQIAGREVGIVLLLILLTVGLQVLPNPMRAVLERRGAAQQVLSKEAEKLLKLGEDLKAKEPAPLPNAEPGGVTDVLQKLGEDLKKRTPEYDEALAKIAQAEQKLASMQNPGAERAAQAMRRASSGMASEQATQQVAGSLEAGDYAGAARGLRDLGADNLSGEQRQQLARALREASQDSGRLDPGIGESLRQAADAAERGTQNDLQQALDQAASQFQAAGQNAAAQEALRRALAQLDQSRNAIGNAQAGQGQPQNALAPPSQSGQPGDGQGQEEGRGQGQSQGDDKGSEQGQGSAPGLGTDSSKAEIYAPDELAAQPDMLPSQMGDGASNLEIDPQLSRPYENEAQTDYTNVFANYEQRAINAMDKGYIPLEMKDLVRDYFSSLAPKN